MSTTSGPRMVAFPSRRRAGLVGNYSLSQLLTVLAGIVTVVVGVLVFAGDVFKSLELTLLPAVALVAVGLWTDEHGYPLVDQVGVRGRYMWRKTMGQTTYRRKIRTRLEASGKLHLPGGLAALGVFELEGRGAVFEDPTTGVFSAILKVTTPGYGLLDGPQQRERVDEWAFFQSTLIKQPGLARIQVLTVSSLASPTGVRDFYRQKVKASGMEPGWGHEQYELLLEQGVANSPRQEQFIVVVLDRNRLGRDIRAQGGGKQGLSQVMARQIEALRSGLAEADVTVEKWLSAREAAAVVRLAYDPDAAETIDAREGDRAGVAVTSAAPIAGEEAWDHIRTDTAFHQSFEITEWPRIPTAPDFLAAVTMLPFPVALSLYFTPVSLRVSLRRIKLERGKIDSNREFRHRRGNLREDSAFELREREDVTEREREIVQGFGDLEFLGLITVTAPSLDELAANVSHMRSNVEGRGMELRALNGQQLAAFNCARLPLALAPASSSTSPLQAG